MLPCLAAGDEAVMNKPFILNPLLSVKPTQDILIITITVMEIDPLKNPSSRILYDLNRKIANEKLKQVPKIPIVEKATLNASIYCLGIGFTIYVLLLRGHLKTMQDQPLITIIPNNHSLISTVLNN